MRLLIAATAALAALTGAAVADEACGTRTEHGTERTYLQRIQQRETEILESLRSLHAKQDTHMHGDVPADEKR